MSSCHACKDRLCFAILPSVGYVFHKLNVDRCLLNCTNIQLFYPEKQRVIGRFQLIICK